MIMLITAIISCILFHEGGHWGTAFGFGFKIRFRFEWGKLIFYLIRWEISIPIPRWVWNMPQTDLWIQQLIAIAGFGTEFLVVPIFFVLRPEFALWYLAAAVIHLTAYPLYAGEVSDWKWFR